MTINIIVAMTKGRVIGKDNSLPWDILEEKKLFRELTKNKAVVMGRNTWLSIPEKHRPLSDRINIIVSRTLPEQRGAIVCKSVEEAVGRANRLGKEVYCIGGAQIYAAMLPMTQFLHISWIKKTYEGDAYFPDINFNDWQEQGTRDFAEFTYKRYTRKL